MKMNLLMIAAALALALVSVAAVAADAAESTTTKTTKTTTNPDGTKTVEETTVTKSTTSAGSEKPVEPSAEAESKEDFKAKIQTQIDSISQQIDSLKKDASTASSDAKVKIEKKIAVLEKKRDEVTTDLAKVGDQTGRAWTKFKSGVTKAVDEIQDGYKAARKEFSKDAAAAEKKAEAKSQKATK